MHLGRVAACSLFTVGSQGIVVIIFAAQGGLGKVDIVVRKIQVGGRVRLPLLTCSLRGRTLVVESAKGVPFSPPSTSRMVSKSSSYKAYVALCAQSVVKYEGIPVGREVGLLVIPLFVG